jgi:hypothetical protein
MPPKKALTAPLLLSKVPTIVGFYKKVKDLNQNSKAEVILKFIKEHEDICIEKFAEFEHNFRLNLFYMTAPLVLKGYKEDQALKMIEYNEFLLVNELHDLPLTDAVNREELTRLLISRLSQA